MYYRNVGYMYDVPTVTVDLCNYLLNVKLQLLNEQLVRNPVDWNDDVTLDEQMVWFRGDIGSISWSGTSDDVLRGNDGATRQGCANQVGVTTFSRGRGSRCDWGKRTTEQSLLSSGHVHTLAPQRSFISVSGHEHYVPWLSIVHRLYCRSAETVSSVFHAASCRFRNVRHKSSECPFVQRFWTVPFSRGGGRCECLMSTRVKQVSGLVVRALN